MQIEVAYATESQQQVISLNVSPNISVKEAIILSAIDKYFPELLTIDWDNINIGIFGKKIDWQIYQLKEYDRIEIYRPLKLTPNQKRLLRSNK
jgi:putative ubiquitin-RnfH superfamily antitoxin RatB of RatAB toxin-antitoxin module